MSDSSYRFGISRDIHRLKEGTGFILCSTFIPCDKMVEAHSDGDVLLHAIIDALLGASALGDIGSFFPPEDEQWKDASSVSLLKIVWNKILEDGWHLENLDCIVKLEKPKFLPYRAKVIKSIAECLGVNENQVFVKAKTAEKLDSVGVSLAVEAWCSCLLSKQD